MTAEPDSVFDAASASYVTTAAAGGAGEAGEAAPAPDPFKPAIPAPDGPRLDAEAGRPPWPDRGLSANPAAAIRTTTTTAARINHRRSAGPTPCVWPARRSTDVRSTAAGTWA